ncbi:hypothetical protein SLNSH_02765 [Alsobacter soli]|uniref:Uncharacterized protein n=1 Tax=Alsobacter soli TaxID=2109933 RepID=A0A2T1HYP5_9HYPH|nr:hypothetical protein [Alsobacter soli]PSC06735.1 hypothetical protein SLNSH_02765 [Alsobacter soli]
MGSIKRNALYGFNDPNIAKAFGNISKMFAPPDASDIANYATAAATREKAQRLTDFFRIATQPGADRRLVDQYGVAAGVYNPNQSYYSVDLGDATNRRGQDITAQTQRYGYDTQAATSRANNAADNQRALQTNAADNQRAAFATRYGPLSEGQSLPAMPESVAGMFGLPAQPTPVTGITKLNEGQIANVPGGDTLQGRDKPRTSSEVEGQILSSLTPQDQRAVAMKGVNPTAVVDPATGGQTYVNAADAAGRTPIPDAARVANGQAYDTKTGQPIGPAISVAGGKWQNPQTGDIYGPEVGISNLPTIQASNPGGLAKTTEAQDRAGYAYVMSDGATNDILNAFDTGKLPTSTDTVVQKAMQAAPILSPAMVGQMSPQGQVFFQNLRSTLPYQLMVQSGQAVTEQEAERKIAELVPVPGEDPAVTQARRRQFEAYRKGVRALAGPAIANMDKSGAVAPAATATAAPNGNAPGAAGQVQTVATPEDADRLPVGTRFRTPDGREFVR